MLYVPEAQGSLPRGSTHAQDVPASSVLLSPKAVSLTIASYGKPCERLALRSTTARWREFCRCANSNKVLLLATTY